MKVAYLLSRYPAPSHTFFLAEVEGLRAKGMEIRTASINPAITAGSAPENAAVASTKYIKSGGMLALAGESLLVAMRHPVVFLRGVAVVLGLKRASLRERGLWMLYLGEAMVVGAWMRREGLDHLHVHFGGPVASVGMLTAKAWRVPYSLTIHGPEELLNMDRYRLREKFQAAAFLVCISEFCRSQVLTQMEISDAAKCVVNRLGVSDEQLAPYRKPARRETAAFRVVCTGRLVPEKGQHVLLEACAALVQRGIHLELTLIGDGPQRAKLEARAEALGMAERVRFRGAQSHEETLRTVSEADLFVLASSAEGVPVAIMEAMALDVPVISTYIAGIPELIENGVSGWLVPAGSVTALEAAIARAVNDAPLGARIAAAARNKIATEYDLETNHTSLANIFRTRVASPAGSAQA